MKAISRFLSRRKKKNNNNNNKTNVLSKSNNRVSSRNVVKKKKCREGGVDVGVDLKQLSETTTSLHNSTKPLTPNKYEYRKYVNDTNRTFIKHTATPLPILPKEDYKKNLTFTADFLSAFSNSAMGYEKLLDELAEAKKGSPDYDNIIEKINDFRTSLQHSAYQINNLLFNKKSYTNKIIKYLEILRTTFMKTCKACKETTMTLQALLSYNNYEETEFDKYIKDWYNGVSGISPVKRRESTSQQQISPASRIMLSTVRKRTSTSSPHNAPHDDLEEALLDLLEEAGKIDPNINTKISNEKQQQQKLHLKPVESISENRRKRDQPVVYSDLTEHMNNNNPKQTISWEPVYDQLRDAREMIALQLEKSRSNLKRNVHPYFIRDLHRGVEVRCTAKELQQDGIYLLNEYNLDKLGEGLGLYERGRTFKAITKTSLVIEPFLDFVPRSEAMKNYVSALESIVYGNSKVNIGSLSELDSIQNRRGRYRFSSP